jgi:4-hydroxy-tetrahydrodipicolinate reductase
MSLGISILKELVKKTAKNISEESDIEINETHHNLKRDVPSGTALTLADSINEGAKVKKKNIYRLQSTNLVRKKNEIGFSSIRGGDVVGEHSVYFFMDGERIELTHRAADRKIFSNGALKAAVWIFNKKPGMYSLTDMLG